MISRVGLLDPSSVDFNDKESAYRLGVSAWCRSHEMSVAGCAPGLSGLLSDVVYHLENCMEHGLPSSALIPGVPIKAVAVWDTVGSCGIPTYIHDNRVDLFRFCDLSLSSNVKFGFHAISIDELREDFPVTRWEPRTNLTERWFVGAHADVGGGYGIKESGLSDIALSWLTEALATVQVEFYSPPVYLPTFNYRQDVHTPWIYAPFNALGRSSRLVGVHDQVDETVISRLRAGVGYRPQALAAWLDAQTSLSE